MTSEPQRLIIILCPLLTVVLGTVSASFDTPEYILPCYRSDPQINECVKRAFNHLRPYIHDGIPELKLPPVDPLTIPKLVMENGYGPVRVRAAFSNITVIGASNYTVVNAKTNLAALRMDMTLRFPRIETTGKYNVSGNILLFPVRTQGEFWAVFYEVSAATRIYGREVTRNNTKFMHIEKMFLDLNLSKSRFKVKDYINADNVLGEAMNQFLNQNANEIIKEMKPAASHAISRQAKQFLNNAFSEIPIEVWLKDK